MERVYLSDIVADKIKSYIQTNNLNDGDKLPSVGDWMKELKVARSTMREGLKKLEAEEIIEVINGKGVYVKQQKPFRIHTSFNVKDELSHLLEILEIRSVLEEKAIVLAVEHVTKKELKEMEKHLDDYVTYRNSGDLEAASEADSRFHQTIYKASNNNILYEVIKAIHQEIYVLWDTPYNKEKLYDESFPYHVQLLDALKSQNKKQAVDSFRSLLNSVHQNILILNNMEKNK